MSASLDAAGQRQLQRLCVLLCKTAHGVAERNAGVEAACDLGAVVAHDQAARLVFGYSMRRR